MTLPGRNGVFWWLYVVILAGAALFIAYSFVGILVLGLFGYYAIRPICARFETVIESKPLAAALTVSTVLVPVILLALYAGLRVFQQLKPLLDESVVSMLTSRLSGLEALQGNEEGGLTSLLRNPPSLDQLTDLFRRKIGFTPVVQTPFRHSGDSHRGPAVVFPSLLSPTQAHRSRYIRCVQALCIDSSSVSVRSWTVRVPCMVTMYP
jgi:hypothetical protein